MNQSFINKIKQNKYFYHLPHPPIKEGALYQALFIRSDRWRYGDLYGLSYLPQYKFALEPFKQYTTKPGHQLTNRILYIIGDSFLADKTLYGAFDDFDKTVFLDRRFAFGPIQLDTTKQNYLILEFAERNLNDYDIAKTDETLLAVKGFPKITKANTPASQGIPLTITCRLNAILFNKNLSRNLEMILFDNTLATPFKELKASLNYHLFGRVANEVAVSSDKKRLFLSSTVDTGSRQSAFRVKSDEEINQIDKNLDVARNYYQAIGFKKVFLSVVPNPVSLYDSKRLPYNHLLERVEEHSPVPAISLLVVYKADKRNLFYCSESHWNPLGLDIWVNQTNKVLRSNLN